MNPAHEALRVRFMQIALQMLRDKLCRTYGPRSKSWSMNYVVERKRGGPIVTYVDYGVWRPVPAKYEMPAAVAELLPLIKKRKPKHELTITVWGIVSVDDDRGCVLLPPRT
jgi:hypothetical protein